MDMAKVWIHVTKRDIEIGRKLSCYYCPIAIAIDRRTRDDWRIGVLGHQCAVFPTIAEPNATHTDLPEKAIEFIAKFDFDEEVRPIRFQMELPRECLRQ